MFGGVRRFLGAIKVVETETEIVVEGIPADLIQRDIRRIWSTERINQFMFSKIHKNGFSFPKFFALDVIYALRAIVDDRRGWTKGSTVHRLIDAIMSQTWLRSLQPQEGQPSPPNILDFNQLNRIKIPLLKHQLEFLHHYNEVVPKLDLTGYLLSAAAGTGKTLTLLALAACLKSEHVFFIVPKNSIDLVWTPHIREKLTHEETYWSSTMDRPYKGEKYIICHYEALDQALAIAGQISHSNVMVALDESHNFNESTTARTAKFVELCHKVSCQNVLWSSGTPLKAMGYEMIPILKTIAKYFTADVEMRFRKIFGTRTRRAIDILRNRIGLVSFKVEKTTVTDNKPTSETRKITIPNGQRFTLDVIRQEMASFIKERLDFYMSHMGRYEKLYKECLVLHEKTLTTSEQKHAFSTYKSYVAMIRKGYDPEAMKKEAAYCNDYEARQIIPSMPSKEYRDDFKDVKSIIKYVKLKVMGEALGGILGRRRAECHVEMVKHIDFSAMIDQAAKKTVIFTSFVDALKATMSKLTTEGKKPLAVYGETNSNVNGIVSQFGSDAAINPLVTTFKSMSTAVPLIMANQEIFLNRPFREHEEVQAKARVDRLGQDTPVHYVFIELDTGGVDNISTRSSDILAWSKAQVEAMMGGEGEGADKTLNAYFNSVSEEAFADTHNGFDISFESHFKDYCGE